MTGIATDVGNILGQACRSDTKAELWRLKVHVPILFGFIADAAEQSHYALPHELHFMDNYEGDPRKYQEYHKEQLLKQVDHYAKITGKNVDDEIRRF
ncbi:hypothetical protein BSLG_005669 [Batrachochytrium salamandrivorans]|nr:hypothetical protein BSLG_005669 [Batrachochytrium salamandrivorans]